MVWLLTLLAALTGAIVSLIYILAMTENIGPIIPALFQLTILIGPYAVLGLSAWFIRSHRTTSYILLGFTLALTSLGLIIYSIEYFQFQNRDQTNPGGQNFVPFLLAVAQWLVTVSLSVILVPWFIYQNHKHKQQSLNNQGK